MCTFENSIWPQGFSWGLWHSFLMSLDKAASLHLEFPACTTKRMTVGNLLGTDCLINYSDIATASSHWVSQGSPLLHAQDAVQLITVSFIEKGSRRGPCTILESFEQQLQLLLSRNHNHFLLHFSFSTLMLYWPTMALKRRRTPSFRWVSHLETVQIR